MCAEEKRDGSSEGNLVVNRGDEVEEKKGRPCTCLISHNRSVLSCDG
jgi:hypothetical protein